MTTTRQETLRECIERGARGEFAKSLLAFYTTGWLSYWAWVMSVADYRDREALLRAADKAEIIVDAPADSCTPFDFTDFINPYLRAEFPFLAHLDEPASEWPDLRGDQS